MLTATTNRNSPVKIMADFRPFQAWRYHHPQVDLSKVIAPPYDVISPAEQEALYQRSEYNCVRLILNRDEPGDKDGANRYTRARDFFNDWKRRQVLIQDPKACFYLYRQTFKHPVDESHQQRFALLGRLKLEPFEKGIVIPHEKTLAKPREDRRKLLEATRTNFSPIFGLYEDEEGAVRNVIAPITDSPCLYEVPDSEGVRHAFWVVANDVTAQRIRELIGSKKVYIADGHHRYQTALEYGRDKRTRENLSGDSEAPSDFVYMALVSFTDPGLAVLPTHRIVLPFSGFDPSQALALLKPYFDVTPADSAQLPQLLERTIQDEIAFGMVLNSGSYFLCLKKDSDWKSFLPAGKPAVWCRLDLNVLAHVVLRGAWKMPEEEWETRIQYTKSAKDAVAAGKSAKNTAAFILKNPRVETLKEMGEVRELMPQKSTYFYPKLASGVVFYEHGL